MDSKSILPKHDNISSSCIGKKGNSSQLLIAIIVPVAGTLIISGFLCYCWLNRKRWSIFTNNYHHSYSNILSVVIFSILCYCFICRKAKKKYSSTEEEKGKILVPDPKDPLFLVVVMLFTISVQLFFCLQLRMISPLCSHCNLILAHLKLLQITSLMITRLVKVDLVMCTR